MGRKKIYTDDELKEVSRKWKMDWYYRNRDKINKIRMEKYNANKVSSDVSREYLIDEYINKKLSSVEIAKNIGIKPKRVIYLMMRYNIPRRNKYEINSHDIMGQRFNKLLVIERKFIDNVSSGSWWKCKCDCGNTCVVRGTSLVNNMTGSCGCVWRSASYEKISGLYFGRLQTNATKRGFEYSVSKQYLWELFLKQDGKCALTNIALEFGEKLDAHNQTASLDRIDNMQGYVEGNVRWVHKQINRMRWDMSDEEFLFWVAAVYNAIPKI